MKMAFILYDDLTVLDFVGFYDAVTRLKSLRFRPDLEWTICARSTQVRDGAGLRLQADAMPPTLEGFDLIFLPGGMGSRALRKDKDFIGWLRTARTCPLKVSVCTGSLLLGAAGFLEGKTATTHPTAYDILAEYTPKTTHERLVDEGDVITGGGVSTSIDLGLYLCERLAGPEARDKIAAQMDYPYRAKPPLRPSARA